MIGILYITPNFTIGGTEGQIFNIAIKLDRTKFTPYVISIGQDYGQRDDYARHNINARRFSILDFTKIVCFMRKRKIDIIHSFYYGNFSGWELLASRLAGVKTFVTSRRNMGYWRKARHIIGDIVRNDFTDVVIANSYAVREKTILDENLTPSKIIVIYNGIDFSRYLSFADSNKGESLKKKFGIDTTSLVIGMISNIKNIKGYDYFLSAAEIIKRRGYNVKFVIAGEGSDEADFKENVKKYDLGDSLFLLGSCKDVLGVLPMIDIFMYSSLSEGFPNIILEAMALAKPIVSTNVGGIKEMLQDGYSALLVPPRDAEALASATVKLISDKPAANKLMEMANRTAKQFFSMDECVRQYEIVYENLYNKKIVKN